ncbi:hypothetical protein HD599_001631 [Conyzicola lurida]|uniref:DUF1206 domain-containing protein n=1 Tax=Conyzicola lurida TaxID=1172621 RepID=A0A841ALT1_9MICO|nr:hypothetical protein [Conyzicola lurida]
MSDNAHPLPAEGTAHGEPANWLVRSGRSVVNTALGARKHRTWRILAQAGLVFNGIVNLIIGSVAIAVAAGAGTEANRSGALAAIAETPVGRAALWVAAVGLAGLAVWQCTEAAALASPSRTKNIFRWLRDLSKAFGFLVVGAGVVVFASGGRTDTARATSRASEFLLESIGGAITLFAIGGIVIAVGVSSIVRGIRRTFLEEVRPLLGARRRIVQTVGIAGHVARGLGFTTIGLLVLYAALSDNPGQVGGLDHALRYLATLPSGIVVFVVIAVGLIAYGLYLFARARFMRR